MKDGGGDVGNLAMGRKELDKRIKWLQHTMDSLRDQVDFAKIGMKGAAGISGPPGPPGSAGRNGRTGAPGKNGANGKDGKNGKQGKEGPEGPQGLEGKPGFVAGGDWTMQIFSAPGKLSSVPDFSTLSFVGSTRVPSIDFPSYEDFQRYMPNVPAEHFVWRFYGKVEIDIGGDYNFCTRSDDRSRLFINGHLAIDNKDVNKNACHSLELLEGVHSIYLDGYNNGGPGGVVLVYSGADTDDERESVASVDNRAVPAPMPSRFTLRMFTSSSPLLSKLPASVEDGTLVGQAVVPYIAFEGVGAGSFSKVIPETPTRNYYYQMFGKLPINKGGKYKICITSSDGSSLSVDEKPLIANDGLHPKPVEKCQDTSLVPGNHDLELTGFLAQGSVKIAGTYSGPDTYFLPVPLRSVDPAAPPPPRPSRWLLKVFRSDSLSAVPKDETKLHAVGEALVPLLNFHGQDEQHGFLRYVPRTPDSNFVFEAFGTLQVGSPGTYKLCTDSKDGSLLEVDGELVVNNDGVHAGKERCDNKVLRAGLHLVKVTGFHGGGRVDLAVRYSGPDTRGDKVLMRSIAASPF